MKYLLSFLLLCLPLICWSQDPTSNCVSGDPTCCLSSINVTTVQYSVETSNYQSASRCAFLGGNVVDAEDGTVTLTVSSASCNDVGANCGNLVAGCAAAASSEKTYYGYYECAMTASGVAGTVLSCMVESTTKAPYENIYIKILGNETRRVFTGYFYGGVNYQTGPVTLPTSTSTLVSHRYAFEWTSGYIVWYFDEDVVTSEYGNRPIPTQPNTFIINQVIEQTGYVTDDTSLSTQSVDRNYVPENASTAIATFTNFSYTPVQYKACPGSGYNPGGNNYVPYDPAGCSPLPKQVIYTDGFVNGWDVTGNGLTSSGYTPVTRTGYDCYDTTPQIRSGTNGIQWVPLPGFYLYFVPQTAINSSLFYSFEFWINGGARSGQQIVISLVLDDGTVTQSVNIAQLVAAGVQSCLWSHVVVPFAAMGVTTGNVLIKAIQMSSATPDTASPKVFLDDLRLSQLYPICANKSELIYGDALATNWKDNSYPVGGSSSPKLNDDTKPYEGSRDIQWQLYDQSSGLFFQRSEPWNTNDYQAISFWVYTGFLRGYNWDIAFGSPDSGATDTLAGVGRQNLLVYFGGNLPQGDNQYSRLVIDFSQLGINANTKLNTVRIYLSTGDYQGTMYIDQMELISNNVPTGDDSDSASSSLKVSMVMMVAAVVLALSL